MEIKSVKFLVTIPCRDFQIADNLVFMLRERGIEARRVGLSSVEVEAQHKNKALRLRTQAH